MLIIPFFILLIILGLEVAFILKLDMKFTERISVSYLLGIGLLTFFVFLVNYIFNLNFSLTNTFTILGSMCLVLAIVSFKGILRFIKNIKFKKIKIILNKKTVFWGIILILFFYTLIINLYWPISDWDSLALYDFRAKVFMTDTNLIHAALTNDYFIQYPLLTSLAHLFVYQIGLPNPKFIYSLFYLSFVVIFYYSTRKNTSENKAMFFTILFALVPEFFTHSMMAYTNLPYIAFFCSGIFYLYEWIKNKNVSTLLLSGFLVGLSCWVRITEPFWWVPLFVVILVTLKNKRWKEILYYLIPVYFFYKVWGVFMGHINSLLTHSTQTIVPANPISPYLAILEKITPSRLVEVAVYLYKNVFSSWGLIVLVFVIMLIRTFWLTKKERKDKRFLYITLLFLIFLYMGTVGFSVSNSTWIEIPDSARRMSMIILPLILYSIALLT